MRKWSLRASMMIATALLLAACAGSDAVGPAPLEIEVDLSGVYRGTLEIAARDTVPGWCVPVLLGGWSCGGYPKVVSMQCLSEVTVTATGNFVDARIHDHTSTDYLEYESWTASVQTYEARIPIDRSGCTPLADDLPLLDSIITLAPATTLQLEVQNIFLETSSPKPDALNHVIQGLVGVDFLALTGCVLPSNSPSYGTDFRATEARHYHRALEHAGTDLVLDIVVNRTSPCSCVRGVRDVSLRWHFERIP